MKFIKYIYILRCYPECGKGVLSCYQFEAKSFEGNLLEPTDLKMQLLFCFFTPNFKYWGTISGFLT